MKIYFYINGNRKTPSTRLRWLNYISFFEANGFSISVIEWASTYKQRMIQISELEENSCVLVQKKLLNYFEIRHLRKRSKRLIFDVDDAIWRTHPHKGNLFINQIKRILKHFLYFRNLSYYDHIISANETLADDIVKINPIVSIVPTAPSDTEVEISKNNSSLFRIVWTGTKANYFYLDEIRSQLRNFLNTREDSEFCIISDGEFALEQLKNPEQVRNIKWTEANESEWIQKSTLGIMPLTLDEWSRGKSAFKLIKYMKLGIPVMATDFGFQQKMINTGVNGYLVSNHEWFDKLMEVSLKDEELMMIAEAGHHTYLEHYSSDLVFSRYLDIFRKVFL